MAFKASELGTSDLTVEFRKEKETHLSRIRVTGKQNEDAIRTALKQHRESCVRCMHAWMDTFLFKT